MQRWIVREYLFDEHTQRRRIGKAGGQQLLVGKALVEAYRGQFEAAHRSVDTATALGGTAPNAIDGGVLDVALMRIEVGLPLTRSPAVDPTQTLPSRLLGTLLLARAGRREEAMKAANLSVATGVYGVVTRRNSVLVLMSVELMLAAVNVNLVAFSATQHNVAGQGQRRQGG